MSYKVGLLDFDTAYQKALMEYFNLRAHIPIQLYVFSDYEMLEQFLATTKLSLLLVGDECAGYTAGCPVVVLTKHHEYAEQEYYLFRYQSAVTLAQAMLRYMGHDEVRTPEQTLFVAVYSPLGRCGKTAYAKRICAQYEKSLYVNWEGFSGEPGDAESGSYFLYCMKSRNEEYFAFLEEQAVTAISAPPGYQDILQINAEDMVWFRDSIRERQLYECVVFDIGSMVLSDYAVLLRFDRVYIPTLPDGISANKLKEFERMLRQQAGEAAAENLQYVEVER